MEGGNQSGSSFASDLFGPKDNPAASSSTGIFGSMFPPPPNRGLRYESLNSSEFEKQNGSGSAKNGVRDKNGSGQRQGSASSYNEQEEKLAPFHYSSSIYYGGQDVYTRPQTHQSPVFATFGKDGEDDYESGHASRGNWWQGSLYY